MKEVQQSLEEIMRFASEEFLMIHALCDKAEIPRLTPDGSRYSVGQRVTILSGAFSNLAVQFLDRKPTPLH